MRADTKKVCLRLTDSQLKKIDELKVNMGFINRSETARYIIIRFFMDESAIYFPES